MKHDPILYDAVVSQFFTDDMIRQFEEMINTRDVRGSSMYSAAEIELKDRMVDFAVQYNGLEKKQQYTQEEMEKIESIQSVLEDKLSKIKIELAIKRLEDLSPEFKEQFPGYKSALERYRSLLKRYDEESW
jgi:hypothetical protein